MINRPHFQVVSTEVVTQNGKKSGNPFHMQSVMFARGDGAAYPVDVFVDAPSKAHAPGLYEISLKSYTPNQYGIDFKPVLGALIPAAK